METACRRRASSSLPVPDSPEQQDRGVGGRRRLHHAEHAPPRCALAHDALRRRGRGAPQVADLAAERTGLERAVERHLEGVGVDRLEDVVARSRLQALDRRGDGAVAGEDDHRHVGRRRLHPPHQLEAVGAGHAQVREHDVDGRPPEVAERVRHGAGRARVVAPRAQDLDERVADVRLVLDHQHPAAADRSIAHRLKPPPRAPRRRPRASGAGSRIRNTDAAALARAHVELALVLAHDRMTDRQAEARRVLGREERLEDALPVGLGDAGTAVRDLGHDALDPRAARRPAPRPSPAAPRTRSRSGSSTTWPSITGLPWTTSGRASRSRANPRWANSFRDWTNCSVSRSTSLRSSGVRGALAGSECASTWRTMPAARSRPLFTAATCRVGRLHVAAGERVARVRVR